MTAAAAAKRTFLPPDLDLSDFAAVEPYYQQLLQSPLTTLDECTQWLANFSELSAAVDEFGNRRYIEKSCHTDDPAIEKAYLHFVEEIEPKIKPLHFRLQQRFLSAQGRAHLTDPGYVMIVKRWTADVEMFREANVPLETQVAKINNEYDKICGAMIVNFRGKDYTLQQLARFVEEPDRATRQAAWEATANRRLQDRDAIDALFEQLLPLRQTIALNAGNADYREHVWKAYKRFDYTPADCLSFSGAIEKTCVPLVRELDEQRRADLKFDQLRPWDLSVDQKNRPALRPFAETDVNGFIDRTKAIFNRLSPTLADEFETLRTNGNLDLQSRPGKQPGGYQCSLEESREPFIFMNAAGLQRDVETLLHEGGHAFHYLASRDLPLVFMRNAPMEFCEVASMSMELLGSDHFDAFYNQPDANRAKRSLLEGIIRFLPWMATIDTFQHWIYTHPTHTRQQRTELWLQLQDRFGSKLDWSGNEAARAAMWQRQLHLFHHPFYYIEYGIAQLGALQLWLKSQHDPRQALSGYRAALALGGTRPLPDLFSTAGIAFDFSEKTLRPLVNAIRQELEQLPA